MVPIPLSACFTPHLRTGKPIQVPTQRKVPHNWRKATPPVMSNEQSRRTQADCSPHSTPTHTHFPYWEDSWLSLTTPEAWRHTEKVTHGAEDMVLRRFSNSLSGSSKIRGTSNLKERQSRWSEFWDNGFYVCWTEDYLAMFCFENACGQNWSHEPLLWVSPASSVSGNSGRSTPETLFAVKTPNL